MKKILILFVFVIVIVTQTKASEMAKIDQLIIRADKVKTLNGKVKRDHALKVVKDSFAVVKNNRQEIPKDQASEIQSRLRLIYKDLQEGKFQSFNEALSEGKGTYRVYKLGKDLLSF